MKKVIFLVLMLMLGISLLTGCQQEPTTTDNTKIEESNKSATKLEHLALGSLVIGMTKEEVINVMGEPTRVEEHPAGHDVRFFYKEDLQIILMDDVVYFIETLSDEYPTPLGLKVGDSKEKLKEIYGEPLEISEDSSTGNETYHYNLLDEYFVFHAEMKDNKIIRLQVNAAD